MSFPRKPFSSAEAAKATGVGPRRLGPVAPPVYRPQLVPIVLQPKTPASLQRFNQTRPSPLAPPTFRPQPVPRVLQTKSNVSSGSQTGQMPRRPVAPPVYRPEPKKVAQPKMAPSAQAHKQPKAPPVYRPQSPARASVLQQRAGDVKNSAPATIARVSSLAKRPFGGHVNRPVSRHPSPVQAKVIQRNIDSTYFEKSDDKAPLYMVDQNFRTTLFSMTNAPPPKPSGLYFKHVDTDDASGNHVFAWTPNVRFLSKSEMDYDHQMMYGPTDRKQKLDFPQLMAQAENPVSPNAKKLPTFGMFGKNDCANFAKSMYFAIAREYYRGEEYKDKMDSVVLEDDYPSINVGDMMLHRFTGGNCGYHGATVVAKDRTREVTLEAHVSKDLMAPEFHVREGVGGFVNDNIRGSRETSTKVEITKYQSGRPDDADLRRYLGANTPKNRHVFAADVGTTRERQLTELEKRAFYHLGHLLYSRKWDDQGWSFFSNKTPDGIVRMRKAYAEKRYWDIFKIAVDKNKKDDAERTSLVRDLYEYLESIWKTLLNCPKLKYPTLLAKLMQELSTWDVVKR